MLSKIKGVMLGHAVGDALGVPVEFSNRSSLEAKPVTDMRGFGTYNVPAGCWSDDTSMSLCALESLSKGKIDYDDIMTNFCKWYYDGEFTATDEVFDIGSTCAMAIDNYRYFGTAATKCGLSHVTSNGNGSLMRIHPFIKYAYYNNIKDDKLLYMIEMASRLTHAHDISIDGCIIYAYILTELLRHPSKKSVYKGLNQAAEVVSYDSKRYYNRLIELDIATLDKTEIKSGGYVVHTLEAAIWCLLTTKTYEDCVLKAVNLGDDTDTVAAIAGGLAGALYGINSIPQQWINTLKKKDYIEDLCEDAYKKWRKNEI